MYGMHRMISISVISRHWLIHCTTSLQLHISINIYYEQQLKYTRKYVYVIPVWKDLSDTVESYYATASSNKLLAICTHFVFKGCHFRIVIWIWIEYG